jgi:hypothetical protein
MRRSIQENDRDGVIVLFRGARYVHAQRPQPTIATLLLEPGEDTGPVVNMTFMPSAAGCPLERDEFSLSRQ